MRELMMLCLKIAGPLLIVSIVVGLIIAIFQAATQIHEQTLTFVPKLLILSLTILVLGSWIHTNMRDFTLNIFDMMASI